MRVVSRWCFRLRKSRNSIGKSFEGFRFDFITDKNLLVTKREHLTDKSLFNDIFEIRGRVKSPT